MFARRERLPRAAFPRRGPLTRLSSPHFEAVMGGGRGYAIVIPKKVLRRAVDRHRLKRRVVGALRHPPLRLPPTAVVYPRASAANLTPLEMRAELATLFSKAH